MSFLQYRKSLAFVESFSNTSFRKNFGPKKRDPSFFLDRTRYFLHSIGDPGKGFKYIHVTGTAGKGTVSTMLQNVLSQAGKKTGLFTSPYSTVATEEIRVGDLYISPMEFVSIVEYLKPFIAKAARGPFGGSRSSLPACSAIRGPVSVSTWGLFFLVVVPLAFSGAAGLIADHYRKG